VAVGSAGFHVRVLAAETTIYGRNYISSELKSYLIISQNLLPIHLFQHVFVFFFFCPWVAHCAMSSEGEPNGPWCSTGAKALNAPGEFDQVDLPRPPAPRKASRGKHPGENRTSKCHIIIIEYDIYIVGTIVVNSIQ
jgi:hypothetical protein